VRLKKVKNKNFGHLEVGFFILALMVGGPEFRPWYNMASQAQTSNMPAETTDFAQSFAQLFTPPPGTAAAPPGPQAPAHVMQPGQPLPPGPSAMPGGWPVPCPAGWPGWPPPWVGVPWPGNYSNGSHGNGNHGNGNYGNSNHSNGSHGNGNHGNGNYGNSNHSNGNHGNGNHGNMQPAWGADRPLYAAVWPAEQGPPLPQGPKARPEASSEKALHRAEKEDAVEEIELEPLQIPARLRVPYAYSMQADIDIKPGNNLLETATEAPEPLAEALPLRTHLEQMLAKTVERCPFIRPPAEPTWTQDIKEAVVAIGHRVSRNIGHQMTNATEEEIASYCLRHLNVSMDMPVYKIFGLQRQAAGSRYLKLTEEAEDALICRRGAEHDRAIDAQARLMVFKDTKQSAQYITKSKNHYVFSLHEYGLDVYEVAKTRHRAIRARNRWFRANQHRKLVQEHVVHTGMYPLMQGTKPITQISPL
jgi:hypothetical protein